MALQVGDIEARISADISGLQASITRANALFAQLQNQQNQVGAATRTATQANDRHQQSIFNLSAAAIRFSVILYALHEAMKLTTDAITGSIAAGIEWNSMLEGSAIKWEVLTKSVSVAREQLQWMKKFAAETPFEFKELDQASSKIKAFGFNLAQTRELIRVFGDVAAGSNSGTDGIERLTRALGQMRAAGKVMSEEMMQLTELGIPAWEMLAAAMGKSQLELRKMVEKGMVPAGQAIPILVKGMDDMFGGLMQRQAQTLEGRFSTLKDTWREILGAAAKPLFDYLSNTAMPAVLEKSEALRKAMVEQPAGGLKGAIQSVFGSENTSGLVNFISLLEAIPSASKAAYEALNKLTPLLAPPIPNMPLDKLAGGTAAAITMPMTAIGSLLDLGKYAQDQKIFETITTDIYVAYNKMGKEMREEQERLMKARLGELISRDDANQTISIATKLTEEERKAAAEAVAIHSGQTDDLINNINKRVAAYNKEMEVVRMQPLRGVTPGDRGRPADIIPKPLPPVDLSEGIPKAIPEPDTKAFKHAWDEFADGLKEKFKDSMAEQERIHQKSQQARIDQLAKAQADQRRLYDEAQSDRVRTLQTTLDGESKEFTRHQQGQIRDFQKALDIENRQRDKWDQSIIDAARKRIDTETRDFQHRLEQQLETYQKSRDSETRYLEKQIEKRIEILQTEADNSKKLLEKNQQNRQDALQAAFKAENDAANARQAAEKRALQHHNEDENDALSKDQEKRMEALHEQIDSEKREFDRAQKARLDSYKDSLEQERKAQDANQAIRLDSLKHSLDAEKREFERAQKSRAHVFEQGLDAEKRAFTKNLDDRLSAMQSGMDAEIEALKHRQDAAREALKAEYDGRVKALEAQKDQIKAAEDEERIMQRNADLADNIAEAQKALADAHATGNTRKMAEAQKNLNKLLSEQAANARDDKRKAQTQLIDDQITNVRDEGTKRMDDLQKAQTAEMDAVRAQQQAILDAERARIAEEQRLFDERQNALRDKFQQGQQDELDVFNTGQNQRLDDLQKQFQVEDDALAADQDKRLQKFQDGLDEEKRKFDAHNNQRIKDLGDQFDHERKVLQDAHDQAMLDLETHQKAEDDARALSQANRKKALDDGLEAERTANDLYWTNRLKKARDDSDEEKRIFGEAQQKKIDNYRDKLDEEKRLFDDKQAIKLTDVQTKVEDERRAFNDKQDEKLLVYEGQLATEKAIFDAHQDARMTRLRKDIEEEGAKFGDMQKGKTEALQQQIDDENSAWSRQQHEKERQYGIEVDSLGRFFDAQTAMHADFLNAWIRRQSLAQAKLGLPMVTPDLIPGGWKYSAKDYQPTKTPEELFGAGHLKTNIITPTVSKMTAGVNGFTDSLSAGSLVSSASKMTGAASVPVIDYSNLAAAMSKQTIVVEMDKREVARIIRNPLNEINRHNGDTRRGS